MLLKLILFILIASSSELGFACASCGCLLSSEPKTPTVTAPESVGYKFDLRIDGVNQNQLRSGLFPISQKDAAAIVNNGEPQEVELYTKNTYITAGVEYTQLENWNLNLQIPMVLREHATLGAGSDGVSSVAGGGAYKS
ncbi:MAG: TonB-dependent receptor, partial [Pseudobdellovibrio sp.]